MSARRAKARVEPRASESKPSAQWTQGPRDLGVLFGLLLRHPDLTVRQRTRDVVLDHLTQSGPFHSSDAIATLLNTTAGTLLDPFRLTDEERDAAVLFARIAFSEVHAQDAVRIVPSSTIGRAGGLVIRRDLSTEYVPRSIFEGRRGTPWGVWSFAPAELPRPEAGLGAASPFRGRTLIDGDRFLLFDADVRPIWRGEIGPDLQRPLQATAHLGSAALKSLGVVVDCAVDRLRIMALTPEVMIRTVASLGRSRWLRLGPAGEAQAGVLTRLPAAPPPTPEEVPALTSSERGVPWMQADAVVDVPDDLVLAALPHIRPPMRWLTSLPEALLDEALSRR